MCKQAPFCILALLLLALGCSKESGAAKAASPLPAPQAREAQAPLSAEEAARLLPGFPVEEVPIRIDGHTICMPNTVALVQGSQQPEKARQLVDYLLSQKVELKLARSQSRQIPLGRIAGESVPEEIQQLAAWAADSVTVQESYHAREPCLAWLKGIYAP